MEQLPYSTLVPGEVALYVSMKQLIHNAKFECQRYFVQILLAWRIWLILNLLIHKHVYTSGLFKP